MKANDYQTLSWATAKPFYKSDTQGARKARALQLTAFTLELSGATEELSNKINRMVESGKNFDVDILSEQLGDILWFVAGFATMLGVKLETLQSKNIQKLRENYPGAIASYKQF